LRTPLRIAPVTLDDFASALLVWQASRKQNFSMDSLGQLDTDRTEALTLARQDVEPGVTNYAMTIRTRLRDDPTAGHARIAHKAKKKGTGSRPWRNSPHHEFRLRAVCLSPFSVRNTSVIRK
jgi:hypothetical protein